MSSDEIKLILERLGNIETGIRNLGARLEAVEKTLEERPRNTQPLWEDVRAQIVEMRAETAQGFERVHLELQMLNSKVEVVHDDILEVRAKQRLLEKEVEEFKRKPS